LKHLSKSLQYALGKIGSADRQIIFP